MNMTSIRTFAKSVGINPGKLSKADLIKGIQIGEGNFACYATARNGECDQVNCSWRDDCLNASCEGNLSS